MNMNEYAESLLQTPENVPDQQLDPPTPPQRTPKTDFEISCDYCALKGRRFDNLSDDEKRDLALELAAERGWSGEFVQDVASDMYKNDMMLVGQMLASRNYAAYGEYMLLNFAHAVARNIDKEIEKWAAEREI